MSISGLSSSALATTAGPSASAAAPARAVATVSVAIPGSPFAQQERTSPGSLVVTPQIPPLLFDPQSESLLSSAVGSLVDTTA